MNLLSIAERMEGLSLGLVRAQNVFVHSMPAEVTKGVMVRENFGGTEINNEMLGYVKAEFQLIVRDSNYLAADTLVKAISAAMRQEGGTLPGMRQLNYLRPVMEPYIYPLTVGGLWEAYVKWEACYVE